ncbi:MAG TPA: hypothetical protein ACHBZ9_02385, partial [Arsenophonus nasoniae]|uniref:hypothetical protein n=1 Tax=Arsenophonus nasoniae TaxID=638 RepID=UPI003879F7A1
MTQNSGQEKLLKQIEKETAAFNRIIHAIFRSLTEEQRKDIHCDLEKISSGYLKEHINNNNDKLHERELGIQQHII